MDLKTFIRDVPDFPKKGVIFRDITPLLRSKEAFVFAVEQMAFPFKGKGVDVVVAPESRGFIFGPAVASLLNAGFAPIRKPGKLPMDTLRETLRVDHDLVGFASRNPSDSVTVDYALEYGKDAVEIHKDAIREGEGVLIVDDLLATGGTAKAAKDLVARMNGAIKGFCFLIELEDFKGRIGLQGYDVFSLVKY